MPRERGIAGSARPVRRWAEMHVNNKTELNLGIRILNLRRDPHASGLRRLDRSLSGLRVLIDRRDESEKLKQHSIPHLDPKL